MTIVIIGNGASGVSAAETIRSIDKQCRIGIFCDEPEAYYSRPRLIEVLAGKSTIDQITIHGQPWYEKNEIDLVRSTRITSIDTVTKQIKDSKGATGGFDKLIIASGARCNVPPIPGADLDKVFTLRTASDTAKIAKAAGTCRRAVVIGGGLLGIEVANSLRILGLEVTVIEVFGRLLPSQLDLESSGIVRTLLERKGLSFLTERKTLAITDKNGSPEVHLEGEVTIDTDMVVFSAGIRPNLDIVAQTPLRYGRGILVDHFMRTSVPDIYACGDCAEFNGRVFGLWQAAREQGAVAGNHVVGRETPYRETVPSTRLKVAGVELASIGEISRKDAVALTVEMDEAAGICKKVFTVEKKIVGAILVGNVKDAMKLQKAIKAGESFEN